MISAPALERLLEFFFSKKKKKGELEKKRKHEDRPDSLLR